MSRTDIVHRGKRTTFTIETKESTTAGAYKLKCRFDGTLTVEGPRFFFYDSRAAAITELNPDKVSINKSVKVSVKGAGFQNTTELRCFCTYKVKSGKRSQSFRAKYLSKTLIVCLLPAFKTSRICKLGVLFSQNEKETSTVKQFSVYEKPPTALSATFIRCNEGFKVLFNKNIKQVDDCTKVFKRSSLQQFGKKIQCKTKGRTLHVLFKGPADLMPGKEVVILPKIIRGVSAAFEYSKDPAEKRLRVSQSGVKTQVNISISGPRRVGWYTYLPENINFNLNSV